MKKYVLLQEVIEKTGIVKYQWMYFRTQMYKEHKDYADTVIFKENTAWFVDVENKYLPQKFKDKIKGVEFTDFSNYVLSQTLVDDTGLTVQKLIKSGIVTQEVSLYKTKFLKKSEKFLENKGGFIYVTKNKEDVLNSSFLNIWEINGTYIVHKAIYD